MKNCAKYLLAITLVAGAMLAGGWIFQRVPQPVHGEYSATLAGDFLVSVRFLPGQAAETAERTAADYRADGWVQTPASTDTFRLFTNGKRMAAFLAEDTSTGVRLTEFKRK